MRVHVSLRFLLLFEPNVSSRETLVEREATVGSAAEEATALETGTMASDAPMNPTTKADTIASTLGQGPNDIGHLGPKHREDK